MENVTPEQWGSVTFYQAHTPPVQAEPVQIDTPQVIQQVVYKNPRIHGFFRTLTIIALLVVGILILLENTGVMKLSLGNVNLDLIYPIFIIFSTIVIWSYRWLFGKIFWLILFLGVVGGFFGVSTYTSLNPSSKSKFGNYTSYTVPAWDSTWIVLSQLNINTLVGNFDIKWTTSKNLVEWTYKSDRNLLATTGVMTNYDYLSLKEDPNRNLLQNYSSNLSFGISDSRVVDIYLKNLLWSHTIDLSDVRWHNAKIQGGIQDLNLILGDNVFADNELEIQIVWWKILITAPQNLGVKLFFHQRAGSLDLTNFDVKEKDYFESKNIAAAEKFVKINISAWVSTFKFIWK